MSTLPQGQAAWGHLGVFTQAQLDELNPATFVGKQLGLDNGDGTVTQYVSDGSAWQAWGSGSTGYAVGAVHFDGANTALVNNTLASGADSGLLTVSFWVKTSTFNGTNAVYASDPDNDYGTYGQVGNLGGLVLGAAAAGYANNVQTNTDSGLIGLGTWTHVLFSLDADATSSGGTKPFALYVNGVAIEAVAISSEDPGFTIALQNRVFKLGEDGFTNGVVGDLAEFWFAPGQSLLVDGAIQPATLAKFYNAGAPVNLGDDGSAPTGTAPVIYLHADVGNEVVTFPVNRGTGGDFSVVGSLTAADSAPGSGGSASYTPLALAVGNAGGNGLESVDWATVIIDDNGRQLKIAGATEGGSFSASGPGGELSKILASPDYCEIGATIEAYGAISLQVLAGGPQLGVYHPSNAGLSVAGFDTAATDASATAMLINADGNTNMVLLKVLKIKIAGTTYYVPCFGPD